jgi:uncharacterized protein (DUF1015 family)
MAHILPVNITHPLRNKVCIFPTEDDCELSSSDINSIIRRNPYSFNNILFKPYIKRLTGTKKHNAIRRQYVKFKKNRIIEMDENQSFYIYNIIDNERNEFVGIIAKVPHSDFMTEKIIKVEKSNPVIVEENEALLQNTGFIAKPITVVHENISIIDEIITKYKSRIPLYEFTRNNGFIHEVWQVLDPEDIEIISEAYQQAKLFYIIDDNDKFDALHNIYKQKLDFFQKTYSGQEAFNFFPAFLISKNQVKIHEYKKGVPSEYSKNLSEVLNSLKSDFIINEIFDYDMPNTGEILLYSLDGKFKLIPKKTVDNNLPDSVIFEQYVLPKLELHKEDIDHKSLQYCDGNRSTKCVENQLNKGNCKFGFIIKPIEFESIETSLYNKIHIPYKSLYIEPRLLKGLFIYEI